MLRKFDYYRRWLGKTLWILVFLVCVGMAESRLSRQQCNDLLVRIDYDSGIRFVNPSDIERILTANGNEPIHGHKQGDIPLGVLEERVKSNPLVRDCEIYHDLDGNLVVEIEQEKPLARWIQTSRNNEFRKANGFYINEEGEFLPLSDRYSARVLLVSGAFFDEKKNLRSDKDLNVLEMIRYLRSNSFWNAQVIQMDVSKKGEINLYTALGNQRIEFGTADRIEAKLTKLRLFYSKVLAADWGRYSRISLKYHDQIVCE